MLVARERFEHYDYSPKYSRKQPQVKRVRKVRVQTKVVYCAVVLIVLGLSFLVASRHAQIASAGYDILTLRKQVQTLDIENQALENTMGELKSLRNIEYIATTKLGMQKPELAEGVQFIPVEYSKAGPKNNVGVACADVPNKGPNPEKKRNFLVQALANIING